jgi:pimeloyl-ACP methyl ester carboxylesterase
MQTHLLSRPGGTIAYDDQGDAQGPLVICAPGLGDLRGEYRFLTPRLVAAGYRVVTLDLRGHGESSSRWPDYSHAAIGDDIITLVRHLHAGPAIVIGTSYAAGAAVCAAAEAPELVAGMVLISPFVRATGPAWQRGLMRAIYTVLFADPWGAAAWKAYYPRLFPTRKPDDFAAYFAALLANLREPGRPAALRAMMTASPNDSETALDRVRAPALVVMGTRDPDFKSPVAEANEVARRVRGEVRMIEGAGHYPHAELPDNTAPAILAFLDRIGRRSAQAQPEDVAPHGN